MKMLAGLVAVFLCAGSGQERSTGWDLKDPGFEAKTLAKAPVLGWYSDDVQFERVTSAGDAESELEGEQALRVTLVEPRPEGRGRASVTQTILRSVETAERELEFSIGLKSRGLSEVQAHFYVWDDQNVVQLFGEKRIPLNTPEWKRYAAPITVPAGHDKFGVFLYLPNEKGGVLWLDDASLSVR